VERCSIQGQFSAMCCGRLTDRLKNSRDRFRAGFNTDENTRKQTHTHSYTTFMLQRYIMSFKR